MSKRPLSFLPLPQEMTFPYFGGPDNEVDERPMSAAMGGTHCDYKVTSNTEMPRKNSHRRIGKSKKEADVRNSFPEVCNKVDSESSSSQLASTFNSVQSCPIHFASSLLCGATGGDAGMTFFHF